MNPRVQQEIIAAYDRRGKGRHEGSFVDRTRRGYYLEIDRRSGQVRQISQDQYANRTLPHYDDGVPVSSTPYEHHWRDDDETCPDCGHAPCVADQGGRC